MFPEKIMSLAEVSAQFHVSRSLIYKKTMTREIPHFKLGKRIFFDAEEIQKWFFERCRREPVGRPV